MSRKSGQQLYEEFFWQAEICFFFSGTQTPLFHLFAKFKRCPDRLHHHGLRSWKTFRLEQAHGFVPRCSAHPLGSGCDRFCSALCRSSRCDTLPGGSRLLSVPGNSGADSYTSQSERGALPGTYTHVKKGTRIYPAVSLHSAISRFCVHGHWNGYAGAISNAKYHHVTLNLFSQILIFPFWNQNCLRIQELQKNHRSYSSAASK